MTKRLCFSSVHFAHRAPTAFCKTEISNEAQDAPIEKLGRTQILREKTIVIICGLKRESRVFFSTSAEVALSKILRRPIFLNTAASVTPEKRTRLLGNSNSVYLPEAVCSNICIPRSVATGHSGFHHVLLDIDRREFPFVGI